MRRLTMLFLGSVVALAGTGCGSGAQSEGFASESAVKDAGQVSGADPRAQANLHLTLGDAADMAGSEPGRGLQITAFEVIPTKLAGGAKPPAGSQIIGVQFLVLNTGTSPYNNTPASGATVIDAKGHSYKPIAGQVRLRSGSSFKTPLRLAPQGRTTGYVAFAVPTGATITKVRFGIDNGKGDTAMWRVV